MYSQVEYEKDWNDFLDRENKIMERAKLIIPISENVVVVQRIDMKKVSTFLHTDGNAAKDNIRTSVYGKILHISDVDTGDDIKELKKKLIKVGDYIRFNPEAAYHLAIPDFYELWCIGIDNVIDVDMGFNYQNLYEESLRKRLNIALESEVASSNIQKERELIIKK